MLNDIFFLIAGFGLLIKGADWLVGGSSSLAKRYRVSELAIGLTLVAFGTSAPELIVNVIASIKKHDDVVMGNIIGSNIFNLMLILGVSGIISPILVQTKTVWKEIPFSFIVVVLLFFLANDKIFNSASPNRLSRIDGIILLVVFGFFMVYIYRNLKSDMAESTDIREFNLAKCIFLISIGALSLVFGGKIVVNRAVSIAHEVHMSEKFIALTIVSAGTSLPELAASSVAAFKKKSDLAIGNVIGSNIFNILLILGSSALVSPIQYNIAFNTDMGILAFTTVLLFIAMFTGVKKKLDRWEAFILLVFFCLFVYYLLNQ